MIRDHHIFTGPVKGGWHAEAADRQGLGQAFPKRHGGTRVGAVQGAGECFQLGLGDEWVGLVVGGPHPPGDGRGQRVGEPVADIGGAVG